MDYSALIAAATEVQTRAYAKYSGFAVGAAVLTKSGKVFVGCNVENISFRLSACAEQVAIGAAVANGETEFVAIAVVTNSTQPTVPCGGCRQVLAEFNPGLEVISVTQAGKKETYSLRELLPRPRQGILESPDE
jgi:cytidine deaminase